eukprot:s6403_g2.t1
MAALILLHCVFRQIELDAARRDGPVGDVVPPVALMSHATAPAAAVAPGSMGDVVPRRARSRSRSRPRTPSPRTSTLQSLRSQNATLRQDVAGLRHWTQVNFGHVGAGAAHDRRAIQEIRDRLDRLTARADRVDAEVSRLHEQVGRIIDILDP